MKTLNFLSKGKLEFLLIISVFLFSYNLAGASIQIKFSVDLSLLMNQNKFNPSTDKVYVRGMFNNWDTSNELTSVSNNVYSTTIALAENSYNEYKYFITSKNAENGGWENNFPVSQSGNRMISIGVKDLILAPVFYNDAEIDKFKSTEHFNFYYSSQDNGLIDDFAIRAEKCHTLVSTALQTIPTLKTDIYFYKDLDQLHLAQGYPENGESSIGSAYGKSKLIMLSPYKMGFEEALGLVAHEYTHCLEAWKTKVTLPAWLNEGVACYYGRNFSTKDWIKSEILKQGKPNIAEVFNGYMGYAYSGIIAYYIIKTKGEAAMAKFVENMNYADIGYANLAALQTDWWNFLDVYLDYQTTVNVKFSVDMTDMISVNYFKAGTDKVYVKGSFNDWTPQQLTLESGTVYSGTFAVKRYNLFEYKFLTNSATAPNGGLELNVDETTLGNRLLDVENASKTLPVVKFNSNAVPGLDMTPINNKINVLKVHGLPYTTPSFSNFKYSFKVLTASEYEAQKPSDALPFDVGFVASDGTINVSEPTTDAQKAVFKDINKAAVYYLCQSYMYFFYQTKGLPLLFKVGFSAYEAGLNPTDTTIKEAINKFGGSFSSFDLLNNSTTFIANSGWTVAYAFGEFMNVYKNWGYPLILNVTANSFDAASWWFNTDNLKGLLDDFNRYLYARFLETDEALRIKLMQETEHFQIYTRLRDANINFPYLPNSLENAYVEFSTNYDIKAYGKLSVFTLSGCADAAIEGIACDPNSTVLGGTAWSSGTHFGCFASVDQLIDVNSMGRHELAHAFQGLLPIGAGTQWLGEGFAFFSDAGPFNADYSNMGMGSGFWKQMLISSLERGTKFFGHRPTYEDTKIYPGYQTDYGYKYLGWYLTDFIYRKGGYTAVKNVQLDDLSGYQKMGYSSGQAFMNDFYFDFDVRVQDKPVVTLISPNTGAKLTASQVNISWTPLKTDVKFNILVSTDNKTHWTEIVDKTTQTSFVWDAGSYNGNFFLKFVAPENLNLESVFGPFTVTDLTNLHLSFPNGGEYFIAEDTVKIQWSDTSIPNIKLEYTDNNGTSWKQINANTPTTDKLYKWVVPNTSSNQWKLRITDVSNASKTDVSEKAFTVLKSNAVGGPYLYDKNTILLLHFDNDLNNRSYYSGNAIGSVDNLVSDPSVNSSMGNCLKTISQITVPHNANLNLTGDWTIEAWVKLKSFNSNNNMYLLTKPGDSNLYEANYSLELNPWWNNVFHGFYFSGTNSRIGCSTFTPTLNEWYHVAFIRDTKNSEIRVIVRDKNRNEVSNNSTKYTGTSTFVNTKDLIIGSGIDGYIDEVRISNNVRYFKTVTPDLMTNGTVSLFPNPTNGIVHIEYDHALTGELEIQVISVSGQIIYCRKIAPNGNITLNLTNFPKGVYFIQIKSKDHLVTQRLILQ